MVNSRKDSMRTEATIVNNIRISCRFYSQDIVLNHRFLNKLTPRQHFKVNLADRIAKEYFTQNIQAILNEPSEEPPLTNRELMQKNSSHWVVWGLRRLVVVALFPVAIPWLMWRSWKKRGTVDFRRSDGAILVEEIDALCEQARIEQEKSQQAKEQHRQELAYQRTIQPRIKPAMEKPTMNDSYQLIRRFAPPVQLNHEEKCQDLQVSTPGNLTTCSIVEQKELPEEKNDSRPIENNFQEIGKIFNPHMLDSFFNQMEQSGRERMTGSPIITSFRINPSMPEDNTFTIDIRWRFLWTNHPSKRITLPFLKHFTLPATYRPEPRTNEIVILPNPEYCGKQTIDWLLGFFAENLNETLNRADKTDGIWDKEAIYKQAYNMATNDEQRVLVLEQLIDALNDYQKYIDLRHLRDEDIERRDRILNKNLDKIKRYLSLLPEDYAVHCPRAVALYDKLTIIYQLVQTNQLDEAWQLYEQMPEINYFTERAFPHLKVMQLHLFIIFIITRHQLYMSPDKQNASGIGEVQILGAMTYLLDKACKLTDTYQSVERNFIQLQLMNPLNELKQFGKQAARNMSPFERELVYQSDTARTRPLREQGAHTVYRNPNESMDDDDDRVINLDMN